MATALGGSVFSRPCGGGATWAPWLAVGATAPWPPQACAPTPGLQVFSGLLHLPFDQLRAQHAQAVQAGLLAKSMLASRDFERAVHALEHITLGPFARHA